MPIGEIVKAVGAQAGAIGNLAGGIFDVIAARGQLKEQQKQQTLAKEFNAAQKGQFNNIYDNLIGQVNSQDTYKGDTSLYEKMVSQAEKDKIASSGNINPADSLAREEARLSTANQINFATKGARSGTDLIGIAGLAANQEAANMRGINLQNAQLSINSKENANRNYLSSLEGLAGASMRERGYEFESKLNKSNSLIGLTREQGLGGLEMDYRNQQQAMAIRASIQDTKSSMWSSAGNAFRAAGNSIAQNQQASNQMSMFKDTYGSGVKNFEFQKEIKYDPTIKTDWSTTPGKPR